ncbi:MAG: hypothetical protein TECD_00263 [Hyphomicrobiaceae bacterium hypho_1]
MIPEEYRLTALFIITSTMLTLLIWGRYRYDIIALGALVVAVLTGVVPGEQAFEGFGHPATIIIALVLVASHGLTNSGAINLIVPFLIRSIRGTSSHIGIMGGIGAALSTVMNNVGALALLMPVDLQTADKAQRSPAPTLMPLSFATILGGLVTLIGTPPNIVVSSIREQHTGQPFQMFDFAPVGLGCAIAGITFVALIGWRLLPKTTREREAGKELFELGTYLIELTVNAKSKTVGKRLCDLNEACDTHNVTIIALLRDGLTMPIFARWLKIQSGDTLLIETTAEKLRDFVQALELDKLDDSRTARKNSDLTFAEVVVPTDATIENRTVAIVQLYDRFETWLIGLSRQGSRVAKRVRHMKIKAGDVLLIMGPSNRIKEASDWMGTLPLAERNLQISYGKKPVLAVNLFAATIIIASLGLVHLPVALAGLSVLYVLLNIIPLRQVYESVDWPVVVLIGSLIPIGTAMQSTGGAHFLAQGILHIAQIFNLQPWMMLLFIMIITMLLSNILNNTATAFVAAPVAISVSEKLGVNADPFLMGVAISASCAFVLPIGHQNNMLIMGAGGYKFGDYWRIGLPLQIVILSISAPLVIIVWPFF